MHIASKKPQLVSHEDSWPFDCYHVGARLEDRNRKFHENISSVLSSGQKSYGELGIVRKGI